jgi:hypothetical protein
MSSEQFDIIFRGDLVFGQPLAEVKLRLQQLFNLDAAKVDRLFTGRPIALKRGLDRASAVKYQQALLRAGAQVELQAAANTAPTPAAVAAPTPGPHLESTSATSAQRPVHQAPSALGISMPGIGVAPEPELIAQVAQESSLSLRPQAGNILDVSEQPAPVVARVIVPTIELADLGADLINDHEKMELPITPVAIQHWGLTQVGEDLLQASERPLAAPQVMVDLGLDLAPVGADLGQIKSSIQAAIPDTSRLSLADQA